MKRMQGRVAQALLYAAAGALVGDSGYWHCDIGPEPHKYTPEEAKAVARQIAEQRKHKRRRR
jgi:hypothetical protein